MSRLARFATSAAWAWLRVASAGVAVNRPVVRYQPVTATAVVSNRTSSRATRPRRRRQHPRWAGHGGGHEWGDLVVGPVLGGWGGDRRRPQVPGQVRVVAPTL